MSVKRSEPAARSGCSTVRATAEASASDDTTVLLWDVKGQAGKALPPRAPAGVGLEALWGDLIADDGFSKHFCSACGSAPLRDRPEAVSETGEPGA